MKYSVINKIYENIYKLRCRGVVGTNFLSKILLRFCDPIIITTINSQKCFIHFSHQGVYYMYRYPKYDKNLGIICSFLKELYNRNLCVVDIGANVGDTILCIGDKENYYYAFEGEKRYYSLLRHNIKDYKYKLYKFYCGDKDETKKLKAYYKDGTESLVGSDSGDEFTIRRVDSVLFDTDIKIDLIKIDTDGFDFAVIRGMLNTLNKFMPIVYFEWSAPELLQNNENLTSVFSNLNSIGYNKGLIFDKYGNFITIIETSNSIMLNNLIMYSLDVDLYYDVCLLNNYDESLIDILIEKIRSVN